MIVEHDDRGAGRSNDRGGGHQFTDWSRRKPNKVMFKPQIHSNKLPRRPYLKHIDEDVLMNGRVANGEFAVKLREARRNDRDKNVTVYRTNRGYTPNDTRHKKRNFNDFNNWYKITVGQIYIFVRICF